MSVLVEQSIMFVFVFVDIHVVFSIGKQYVCVSVPAEQRIRLDCLFVLTTIHLFWKVKVLFVTLTLAWMWFNTPLVYVICV